MALPVKADRHQARPWLRDRTIRRYHHAVRFRSSAPGSGPAQPRPSSRWWLALSRRSPGSGQPRHSRRTLVAALLLVATLLLTIGFAAGLTVGHGLAILDEARAARSALRELAAQAGTVGPELDRPRLDSLTANFQTVRTSFDRLASKMRDDPLVSLLRWLPVTGDQVRGADHLLAAGQRLIDAVDSGMPIAQGYVAARERHQADPAHDSQLASLVALMATTIDDARRARASVGEARREMAAIPTGLVSQIEDTRVLVATELDRYEPLLDAYLAAAEVLPSALGWDGEKRYLVLAEDSAELRPSGGFIGTYGIIGFDRGRIVEKGFRDVYLLEKVRGLPFVKPPESLARHQLGTSPWRMRDVNWSPDFPTVAQEALRLYRLESGDSRIDGVIAMTTFGMDTLLQGTGPITVAEYGVTVKPGETAITLLQHTRNDPAPGVNRKTFVADFADEVMRQLLETPPGKWSDLAHVLGDMGRAREALAWLADPAVQRLVTAYGWDGAVRQDPGDYLFVVDANVRPGSKLSAVTSRSERLDLQLNGDGTARETLAVSWTNAFGGDGGILKGVQPLNFPNLGSYVRILLPIGSVVTGPTGDRPWKIGSPMDLAETDMTTEAGRLSVGHYHQVPPGTTTLTYHWTTGVVVQDEPAGKDYRLTIQKQPGTPADVIEVSITLPPGATLLTAFPGLTVSGSTLTLVTTMTGDLTIDIRYNGV